MVKNYLSTVLIAVLCIVFSSCETLEKNTSVPVEPKKDLINAFTTYTIRQNNHFANNNFGIVKTDKIKFVAVFDESAIYTFIDKTNQADINKLYGFSDCSTGHQSNSARFGWRWYNNQLEILAYTYKNQQRFERFITVVDINKEYDYELEAVDNKYIFKLNGKTVEMARGCVGNYDKYKLFPYFGGNEVAPHEIKVKIKEVI